MPVSAAAWQTSGAHSPAQPHDSQPASDTATNQPASNTKMANKATAPRGTACTVRTLITTIVVDSSELVKQRMDGVSAPDTWPRVVYALVCKIGLGR